MLFSTLDHDLLTWAVFTLHSIYGLKKTCTDLSPYGFLLCLGGAGAQEAVAGQHKVHTDICDGFRVAVPSTDSVLG